MSQASSLCGLRASSPLNSKSNKPFLTPRKHPFQINCHLRQNRRSHHPGLHRPHRLIASPHRIGITFHRARLRQHQPILLHPTRRIVRSHFPVQRPGIHRNLHHQSGPPRGCCSNSRGSHPLVGHHTWRHRTRPDLGQLQDRFHKKFPARGWHHPQPHKSTTPRKKFFPFYSSKPTTTSLIHPPWRPPPTALLKPEPLKPSP